jgi:hypothetical protein
MRGGALPPALLFAALGFALSFAPRRAALIGVVLALAMAVLVSFAPLPTRAVELVFAGCWISVALTAASVHLPRRIGLVPAMILAVNAGLWGGAVVAEAGARLDLLKALPLVLLCLPGGWLVRTERQIAIKVAASWLIAVSILAGSLPFLPTTPGYAPDHME